MKTFYMKTIVLLAIISGVACKVETPLSSKPSDNNRTYKIDYLFEHDGCKVYRFHDHGSYVYFTTCNGETIAMKDSVAVRTYSSRQR